YLNLAPIIYCGLKRLDYKACFVILILTILVICLRVKITPTSLYSQAFGASLRLLVQDSGNNIGVRVGVKSLYT
ncbi:MAG: hypothetical protein JW932_01820, partial [Deltaproteobacteria bacterium]|nr:hypothetical protein [Deltaproteobacteria bacterium]